jgi:hypothetical protein
LVRAWLRYLAIVPGPLTVLFLSVVFIVVAIAWLRLHAFFALLFPRCSSELLTAAGRTGDRRFIKTIEEVMRIRHRRGQIGFTIAIAAVIGWR